MITKLERIKNIGCFEELSTVGQRPFDKVNVIFGNNGSGKTTISNLFFLLSKHCKDKQTLLEELTDEDSVIEISTDSEKFTLKSIINANQDIYVFNSKFISDSVYNGNSANIASFSNEIKLTNETINLLDDALLTLRNRNTKVKTWIDRIQEKLDTIWEPLSSEFQSKVNNARLTGIKPSIVVKSVGNLMQLKSELSRLYWSYDTISKQSVTISRLEAQKDRLKMILNIELDIETVKETLSYQISQNSKSKIQERINGVRTKVDEKNIHNQIGDLNDWYKKGGRLLYISKEINSHCPLCDSNLKESIDSIISDYTAYYSESMLRLFDFLDNGIGHISNIIFQNFIEINKTVAKEVVEIINLYDIKAESYLYKHEDLLLSSINTLLECFKEKKSSPELRIEIADDAVKILIDYQLEINRFRKQIIDVIDQEIKSLQKKTIDSVIKEIKERIKVISSVDLNQKDNIIFISKNRTNSDIATKANLINQKLEGKIKQLEIQRSEEVSKLNAESRFVNLYLKHFGINHFSIDKVNNKEQDNIIITFSKTGRTKSKFGYSLSEGEKTALAFAYFISKLRVEKIEGNKEEFNKSIIVIDDPISSLDDNRMFQTANLIDSFLFFNKESPDKQPEQVFILSHSLIFVKYMFNALRTNIELNKNLNEYYLSNLPPYLIDLPTSLKNFTNTYISKLTTIIDFNSNKIEYELVKNYLPNYIRIVLETFLGFKLAKVNDSWGKLPGLDSLIKSMATEFSQCEEKEVGELSKVKILDKLNHLKKISDHESHGNIHKAEEFIFISEHELKEFAKYTIQVISYIDAFHFKKIKGHLK